MLTSERYKQLMDNLSLLAPFHAIESSSQQSDNDKQKDRYDKVLDFTLHKVLRDVSNYLNVSIDDIPEELNETIVAIALQVINTHEWLTPDEDKNNSVASLSEGDTSVNFKSPAEVYATLQSVNTLTDNYLSILNNFREVKW